MGKKTVPKKNIVTRGYAPKNVDNICVACNGSGVYDTTGSPKCGSCDGTGKEVETYYVPNFRRR